MQIQRTTGRSRGSPNHIGDQSPKGLFLLGISSAYFIWALWDWIFSVFLVDDLSVFQDIKIDILLWIHKVFTFNKLDNLSRNVTFKM